jgi:hypothetical protein
MRTKIAALVLALVAGCSAGRVSRGGVVDMTLVADMANTIACTVTLAGAQMGTFDCMASGVWSQSSDVGAVGLSVPGQSPAIAASLSRPGEVTTGTWTQADAGADSGLSVSLGLDGWGAGVGSSFPVAQGSYTLQLTDVTVAVLSPNGKGYTVHGTLDATLPPAPGTQSMGDVRLRAQF